MCYYKNIIWDILIHSSAEYVVEFRGYGIEFDVQSHCYIISYTLIYYVF